MTRARTYSDEALVRAVAQSLSWRGVLRMLGLSGTSAASIRSVRRRADLLGLDHRHFATQRHWNDGTLQAAVAGASSWSEVVERFGDTRPVSTTLVKGHARRLGIDTRHLDDDIRRRSSNQPSAGATPSPPAAEAANLRRAGPSLAAAWFLMSGDDVSWPLEPCAYDLLVWRQGTAMRVQVKTTTLRSGSTWAARLTHTHTVQSPSDPANIDCFFIVAADLTAYLIPAEDVGGRFLIHLSAYEHHRVSFLAEPPTTQTAAR